jgi:hypothetical protein
MDFQHERNLGKIVRRKIGLNRIAEMEYLQIDN